MPSERERLKDELCKLVTLGSCAFVKGCHEQDELADFILADRKRVLALVKKPLAENILKYPLDQKFPTDRVNYPDSKLAVLSALSIITELEGE